MNDTGREGVILSKEMGGVVHACVCACMCVGGCAHKHTCVNVAHKDLTEILYLHRSSMYPYTRTLVPQPHTTMIVEEIQPPTETSSPHTDC